MAYFCPPLVRANGVAPKAESTVVIDGKSRQGWSRHRNAENPWIPGEDKPVPGQPDAYTVAREAIEALESELRRVP